MGNYVNMKIKVTCDLGLNPDLEEFLFCINGHYFRQPEKYD